MPYRKIEKKPCENCNGTGKVRNKYGVKISCLACTAGRQKHITIIEELPEEMDDA